MTLAGFTVHVPRTGINATIDVDPDTLNKTSSGTRVVVYIELLTSLFQRQGRSRLGKEGQGGDFAMPNNLNSMLRIFAIVAQ